MKIQFRQSGGYAGLMMGCEINTDFLPPEEAARLESLVKQSSILQAKSVSMSQARDLLNYELTIETSEGVHKVSFDDMSLPRSIEPLLDYLQERVEPLR